MAKIATGLNQSRELAKILPIESADMYYAVTYDDENKEKHYNTPPRIKQEYSATYKTDIPCWSLSALLEILKPTLDVSDDGHCRLTYVNKVILITEWYESGIDACVALIKRLNERELI